MTWQEAVAKSTEKMAMRLTDAGYVVQVEADGTAYVATGSAVRVASACECQGFEDWQPLDRRQVSGDRVPDVLVFTVTGAIDAARSRVITRNKADGTEWVPEWVGLLEGVALKAVSMSHNLLHVRVSDAELLAHVRRQAGELMEMVDCGLIKAGRKPGSKPDVPR